MKVILGLKDFGLWLRQGKYHLTNNLLANKVIKKGFAKEICEVSQDDLSTMIASFKINGIPKELVDYLEGLK